MRSRAETLTTGPAAAYRGTFAPQAPMPELTAALPPGWEGLYFPFDAALDDLRTDGSPARDGVLPEIDLPRRMYAGEDTRFLAPLRYGDAVEQRVRAGEQVSKTGRSGRLVFADLVREYRVEHRVAIESTWHDVFMEGASSGRSAGAPAPAWEPQWRESVTLDARQLFRFSALTFNTHRIHYDRSWARDVEGLDDLLVHGPLLRILTLDALARHRPDLGVSEFSYRSHAPVLLDTEIEFRGRVEQGAQEIVAVSDTGALVARGVAQTR